MIVPGCPTHDDGRLSGCLWQRAGWATLLWEEGATRAFITSGSAVQNRYIEAEALKAGMVSLGVPEDVIHLETQALHTDQNAAYALRVAQALGFERLGTASHGGQAAGMRAMLRGWGTPAVALRMDVDRTMARLQGHADVRVEPVAAEDWLPMRQRERILRKRNGKLFKRPNSFFVYGWGALVGNLVRLKPPEPPGPEPTLSGERYRIYLEP
ncbi:MAG: YdcF family protein [Myxococcales bacterium]|nr:YdcF family protein [Myxococcales bacterium]